MDVVLLANDLMVTSRIQGAASRVGARVHSVMNSAAAIERCHETNARLVVIDLSTPAVQLDFVRELKSDEPRSIQIVAFGPHVHEDRLQAAREAGCDIVLSRGQFFSSIDTVLDRAAS
jgi:CheY-like chemotaxis protein